MCANKNTGRLFIVTSGGRELTKTNKIANVWTMGVTVKVVLIWCVHQRISKGHRIHSAAAFIPTQTTFH